MAKLSGRYLVYDVFTDETFGGNPLASFPDATPLPDDALQKIAREFNFSETTFVTPPADPAHRARVRIFTPTQEIPFAGHPTIGTALALATEDGMSEGDLVLELGVGPIPCKVDNGTAQFVTEHPLEITARPEADLVARCVGLTAADLAGPPVQASLGLPFVFAELRTRDLLSKASPVESVFAEALPRYPVGHDFSCYYYVRDGETVHARMFAPLDNIPEDPATGSAAATLTALLQKESGAPLSLTIEQGVDMGRPSRILSHSDGQAVKIKGQAVRVMEGLFFL